jgi:hypothetical protein
MKIISGWLCPALVLAGILIALHTQAQDGIDEHYLGIQVSPNFTYRVLSNNTNDQAVDDLINFLNNREKAAPGYRIAANYGAKVWKNWDLELGISVVNHSTNLNLIAGDTLTNYEFLLEDAGVDEVDIKFNYGYLGIPVRIIWNFGTDNTRILASLGLTPQLLLRDRIRITSYLDGREVGNSKEENTQEISGFNLSPQIGIGIQFSLNERLFLRGEGIARFGVLDINEDSPVNAYLYSSELNVGLYYTL